MSLTHLVPDAVRNIRAKFFRRTRYTLLLVLTALLVLCVAFAWTTRDAMSHLSFIAMRGGRTPESLGARKTIVDLSPWQTAQALAPLAVTAEEKEFAHEAERLADHEVDQAFASALRQATIQVQHTALTGIPLTLAQRVKQFQQLLEQDRAVVRQLSPASSAGVAGSAKASTPPADDDTDLEIAKAQLQLDSDQLDDAQEDLARASGDERAQIQGELTSHEASMKKYDSELQDAGQIAVLAVNRYGTLSGRLGAWNRQRTRYELLRQAMEQAQKDVRTLTDQHNALEAKLDNASPDEAAQDRKSRLSTIKEQSAEHQLLTIYDDRIQTEQQLVTVYTKWAGQVLRQHRTLLHLILQSTAFVLVTLLCMILGDALVRRLVVHPVIDRRRAQTLRMILELCVQLAGAAIILVLIFGAPHQTPTILGITTAALTFVLQDFVLAFFGWFVLMGKKGIRVGDWVEINGVGGEVTELGLMKTTLLETGNLADRGYPTGRRITFMNSFAIRGQYFNFSTTGQWMWDQLTVGVPAALDTSDAVDRILKVVQEETQENTRVAEQEWKRGTHGDGLSNFRTDPAVNLRPSGAGVDLEVRYVTRASERVEMRNRLYRHLLTVLHEPAAQEVAGQRS